MKLESLENYRKDTASFKLLAGIAVIGSLAGNVLIYYMSREEIKAAYEQIWVVDQDYRPYIARASSHMDHEERIFEYEEAVREFYENAFTCDDTHMTGRDQSVTLERALHLSGYFANGQTIADIWTEENIFGNVLESGWIYSGRADSILFDMRHEPVRGYAFGKQQIRMRRRTITRNMHFTFEILDLARRTRQNPFAVRLDNIDIFNNKVLTTRRD